MRFARLHLLLGALALALALVLCFGLTFVMDRAVEDRTRDRLRKEIDLLASQVETRLSDRQALDAFVREAANHLAVTVTVIAPDGGVIDDSSVPADEVAGMEKRATRPEVVEAATAGYGSAIRRGQTLESDLLFYARRLGDAAHPEGTLRLAVPLEDLRHVESSYDWLVRGAVFASCALLFGAAVLTIRRLALPIREVTAAALAVSRGDLDREPPEGGPAEIVDLSYALLRMKRSLLEAMSRIDAERRLAATVFEQLPDGLVVVDGQFHVVDANPAFRELFAAPDSAGRSLVDVVRDRELYAPFEACIGRGESRDATVRRDRDVTWEVSVRPLPPGSRAAAVGIIRDVTARERNETMRRRFVADVSHELRTPVASIAAAAETLSDMDAADPEFPRLIAVVRRQAGRMRELIEDLTDLSLIESGAITLERRPVLLRALADEVASDLAAMARNRSIRVEVSGDSDATVSGDPRRLAQILRNLLDNAIKFSPEDAAVRICVGRQGGAPFLAVEDSGPGIAPGERDRIFQRFYQVDRSRSKTSPGSGLGLAIVKHLVQLHGARIELDSRLGRGSTFRVLFPPSAAEPAKSFTSS
jgi:two-component system, OmpR family, phosphate regulon sensor histidine kinase PhoR